MHYILLFGIPWLLHGPAAALIGAASYYATQGVVLASTFAVSHNVPESKPLLTGPAKESLMQDTLERDWGVQQLLTSANWGGVIGNFFTGGLNLQIEHHLFPGKSYNFMFRWFWKFSRYFDITCMAHALQPFLLCITLPLRQLLKTRLKNVAFNMQNMEPFLR